MSSNPCKLYGLRRWRPLNGRLGRSIAVSRRPGPVAGYRLYSRSVCDDSVLEDDRFITVRYKKSLSLSLVRYRWQFLATESCRLQLSTIRFSQLGAERAVMSVEYFFRDTVYFNRVTFACDAPFRVLCCTTFRSEARVVAFSPWLRLIEFYSAHQTVMPASQPADQPPLRKSLFRPKLISHRTSPF